MHARIRSVLDAEAFRPVFQPIVELVHGEVIGVEALTRFDDGTPPDQVFLEAARCGLGLELELATAMASVAAARALPPRIELSLNLSPTLVMTEGSIDDLLREAARERPILLEVTEHEEIGDYAAFGAVVTGLGPEVRLAVDDAGAGFASMLHIVELRPSLVKVDRSLIAGIDRDSARQALLVGFQHLTDSIGCELLAEGIETEAELEALRAVGLKLGQGYLLGRPVPIGELRLDPVSSPGR
jgi:EAL domain-containing protein (putative c-di-GMP-specific phosphodiesterase class I)